MIETKYLRSMHRSTSSMTIPEAKKILRRGTQRWGKLNLKANFISDAADEMFNAHRKPQAAERAHLAWHSHVLTQEETARLRVLSERDVQAEVYKNLPPVRRALRRASVPLLGATSLAAGIVAKHTGGRLEHGLVEQAVELHKKEQFKITYGHLRVVE